MGNDKIKKIKESIW